MYRSFAHRIANLPSECATVTLLGGAVDPRSRMHLRIGSRPGWLSAWAVVLACAASGACSGEPRSSDAGGLDPARPDTGAADAAMIDGGVVSSDAAQVDGAFDARTDVGDAAIGTCPASGGLHALDEVALRGASDPCAAWVDRVRGRVARFGYFGSAVVWSRRTDDGYGLLASAHHVIGAGWFGLQEQALPMGFVAPLDEGVVRVWLPPADGALELPDRAPFYDLFHLEIPAAVHVHPLADIPPRNDAFVALIDRSRIVEESPKDPSPPRRTPGLVPLHDPADLTRAAPFWADAVPGEAVLLAGYPHGEEHPLGAVAFARALSDDEARAAIEALAAAGDGEGDIPYDPEAEWIFEGTAVAGMSGGGAFDAEGRVVGILVRASDPEGALRYVRAVRASFVASQMRRTFAALPAGERAEIAPFLDPLLRE
jgi:hypothetical protein